MCGIVGIINREKAFVDKKSMIDFFKNALLVGAVRGKHGTGILGVTEKEVNVYKKPITSSDFLELSRSDKIISDTDNIFLIGHNRHATVGSHTIENSHPFYHDGITLFHNGSLRGSYRALSSGTFNVDSEYICHAFSENRDDIKSVLEKIEGAYSLVWYDESTKTLNFARNEERPMCFARVSGSDSYLFGSESGMISWLASRNGIKVEDPWILKPGRWVKISIDANNKDGIVAKSFEIKKAPPVIDYYQSRGTNYLTTANTGTASIGGRRVSTTVDNSAILKLDSIACRPIGIEKVPASKGHVYLLSKNSKYDDLVFKSYLPKERAEKFNSRGIISVRPSSLASNSIVYCKVLDKESWSRNDLVTDDKSFFRMSNGVYMDKKAFDDYSNNACILCDSPVYWKDKNEVFIDDALNGVVCKSCKDEFAVELTETGA